MTRFLLELITLEKQDGNSKGKNLNEQGKQNVLKELKKTVSSCDHLEQSEKQT